MQAIVRMALPERGKAWKAELMNCPFCGRSALPDSLKDFELYANLSATGSLTSAWMNSV
jgi:hypothetical protein